MSQKYILEIFIAWWVCLPKLYILQFSTIWWIPTTYCIFSNKCYLSNIAPLNPPPPPPFPFHPTHFFCENRPNYAKSSFSLPKYVIRCSNFEADKAVYRNLELQGLSGIYEKKSTLYFNDHNLVYATPTYRSQPEVLAIHLV